MFVSYTTRAHSDDPGQRVQGEVVGFVNEFGIGGKTLAIIVLPNGEFRQRDIYDLKRERR